MGRGQGLLGGAGQPAVSPQGRLSCQRLGPQAQHDTSNPSAPPTNPCPTAANLAHIAIAFCGPLSGETRWGTLRTTRRQRASEQHSWAPRTEADSPSPRAPSSRGRMPAGGLPPEMLKPSSASLWQGQGASTSAREKGDSGRGAPRTPQAAPALTMLWGVPSSPPLPNLRRSHSGVRPGPAAGSLPEAPHSPSLNVASTQACRADGEGTDTLVSAGHSGSAVTARSPDSTSLSGRDVRTLRAQETRRPNLMHPSSAS